MSGVVAGGGAVEPFPENIYGHLQRLRWIAGQLEPADRVLDFGCGTGVFITIPLLQEGFDVVGVDLDELSVEYGRRLLEVRGLDPDALRAVDVRSLPAEFDAIVVSEVLEHLDDAELGDVLELLRAKLVPNGKLIVTTPNGYGWYELESLVWDRLGVGRAARKLFRRSGGRGGGNGSTGAGTDPRHLPMTLAPTPHLQRFTWRSLRRTLEAHGFSVVERRGAVLACGPMSDLALSGLRPVERVNQWLGERLSPVAADFYVVARRT